jgi:hypothetical protein
MCVEKFKRSGAWHGVGGPNIKTKVIRTDRPVGHKLSISMHSLEEDEMNEIHIVMTTNIIT